jgi:hypothetical protein
MLHILHSTSRDIEFSGRRLVRLLHKLAVIEQSELYDFLTATIEDPHLPVS